MNGGAVEQGDTIEYDISATNTGQDSATGVKVTDPIPDHTTYVPGSLQIVSSPGGIAGAKTDATGDDQADGSSAGVTFRVGTGANATSGGTIAPGQSYEVRFRVTIDSPTADGTLIQNTASNTYAALSNPGFDLADASSPPTQLTLASPDLVIAKTDAGGFVNGGSSSFTLAVSNTGSSASAGLVTVTDTVPATLPVTAAAGPGWACGVVSQTVTCTRSDALAAGSSFPGIVISVDVSSTATGAITNTASVAGGNDGDTTNNDGSDTINVSAQADVGITKTLTPAAPVAGDQATYRLVVTNHGPVYCDRGDRERPAPDRPDRPDGDHQRRHV